MKLLALVFLCSYISAQLYDQTSFESLPILPLKKSNELKALKGVPDKTLLQNIAQRPELSVFHSLISGTWLANALEAIDADLTVFAPTNEAFKKWHAPPDNDTVIQVSSLYYSFNSF